MVLQTFFFYPSCVFSFKSSFFVLCSQVAIKNNIDVFYFSCMVPVHALFVEDGKMGELLALIVLPFFSVLGDAVLL